MTITAEPITDAQRIRGMEMPWNRVLNSTAAPAGAAQALNPWYPQEFLAECVETIPEAGEMMTFVFRRVDGAPLAFRSGQYLNIDFPIYGPEDVGVSRSYSISSAPTAPWTFDITVKRDPHGLVSSWIHESVRPGTVLEMLGPVGAFHLPDVDRRARYLLLAAGAGITPLMSMIRTVHSLPGHAEVVVLYHGAAPGCFAFSQELGYLAATDSRINIYYSLGDRSSPGTWEGMVGRLTPAMIEEVAADANGRRVYACGPEGYLNAAAWMLRQVGVDDASINMEFFTGDRQTQMEYREEVAFASEIAQEFTESATEEFSEPQPSEFEFYTANHNAETILESDGLPTEAIDIVAPVEEFSEDTTKFETVGIGEFVMTFTQTGKNVRINAGEQVLDVAKAAGVRIPMNCQEGMCGSCKVIKLQGEVDMNHQGGIRAREIAAGKFLPCCSTPQSDLIIEA